LPRTEFADSLAKGQRSLAPTTTRDAAVDQVLSDPDVGWLQPNEAMEGLAFALTSEFSGNDDQKDDDIHESNKLAEWFFGGIDVEGADDDEMKGDKHDSMFDFDEHLSQ
jgi:hypothetical protein